MFKCTGLCLCSGFLFVCFLIFFHLYTVAAWKVGEIRSLFALEAVLQALCRLWDGYAYERLLGGQLD